MCRQILIACLSAAMLIALGGYGQSLTPRQNNPIQVEVVTLTRFGFVPPKLTRPKGQFILALENRSRYELNVLLGPKVNNVMSTTLKSVPLPQAHADNRDVLDLAPGTYLLVENGHPTWQCEITIKP
jgi:hypothetical protein